MTREQKIRGRRVGILGMARSGVAAAILARQEGGQAFVSDAAEAGRLTEQIRRLEKAGIPFETGAHTDKLLMCDYLIVSPGVKLQIDILVQARQAGIPIFSELEFASWFCKGKIAAITGTNGKTTTTALTGELFKAAGVPYRVCGNIGLAFTEVVTEIPSDGVAIVEVSSFQLEAIADFRPHVAVILNITPDHIDRHGSMEAYREAKFRIAENQSATDFLILNNEDPELSKARVKTEARLLWFSTRDNDPSAATFIRSGSLWARHNGREQAIIKGSEIGILGPHNLQNAAAAVAIGTVLNLPAEAMAKALRQFPGVEHRLEKAGTVAGVNFINDSKATNVDSVCVALRSMTSPTYLILGGRDKGAPYAPIIEAGRKVIKGLIVIGESREKIFRELGQSFPTISAETLEEAVARGFEMAHPGETVLLSPGCASFDMFDNFEHRGRVFKQAVASLKNGKSKGETVTR
ncbi:UDP-N-acetylmuramoyl-L-alanine--D-glutamate ligase [candidate division GN15 bacterium]|uniref:UDP-N-acetylmuramoylalanine--D-glutamate ligase n=1 Tax=candidate division GN15 bacterium TaxID=2072418 RepID=A0A855XBU1_9BACT|nr:MAG: UDP-N-acetylmuramoyl-L-alanine--D-glutamate ligase [candidate division GN15 bacterium]